MAADHHTTAAERCASGIPMILSYLILALTWLAFNGAISIHTVLLKRREFLHFFIQLIVFNGLFCMTTLSLIFASTRNPGQPNQSLAPDDALAAPGEAEKPLSQHQAKLDRRRDRPAPIQPPPAGVDQDDIPLRYLRNAKWVNSRIGKERPSPLPLRVGVALQRESTELSMDEGTSAISPFPIGLNPLMPTSAEDAGEDMTERNDGPPHGSPDTANGHLDRSYDQEGQDLGDSAEQRLLPVERTQRRSVMAKSNDGGPRWCRKCEVWKPDRTHHCRYCKRCTLKMDHHCAWLGTCVGFHNYKPFLLFITYGTLLAVYSMLEASYESFCFFQDPDAFFSTSNASPERINGTQKVVGEDKDDMDPAPLIFLGLALMGLVFALAVGSLAGYHWWLACNNLTTLENLSYTGPSVMLDKVKPSGGRDAGGVSTWKPDHLLSRDERNRLRREARRINVYDLGWRKNIKAVFGDRSTVLAFWPMFRGYRKSDSEAGHFFDVDDDKLARLTHLTRELRCGVVDVEDGYKSESDGSISEEEWTAPDVDGPWTGTSGSRGDDEMSDNEGNGTPKRTVAWFEA